jgi:hypothetical protein
VPLAVPSGNGPPHRPIGRRFDRDGEALALVVPADDEVTRSSLGSISLDPIPIVEDAQDAIGGETMVVELVLVVVVDRECLHGRY